ncbi:MAG: VWA domain-containing protein, partial [Planctomycetaceae bacterium]|nr:VWA domain-containing protein [Planctomycetaceae bacterium]
MSNSVSRFIRTLIPPPRRRLETPSTIAAIVFVAVFAAVCFSLLPTLRIYLGNNTFQLLGVDGWRVRRPEFEIVRELEFSRPWAFLLCLVLPWIWWMQAAGYSGLPRYRGAFALFCRLVVSGILIMVLAEPRAVHTSDVVSVVYAVDVSDSVNESRNRAMEFVASTAEHRPVSDEVGLIVFGRSAAVEFPPRNGMKIEPYINSRVGGDATNIEQSLSLSAAMLPEENRGRVVLISDGTETDGQFHDVLDDLKVRDIEVNVVPIDYNHDREVLLERLDLPRLVRLGETYDASVVLTSLKAGEGELVLLEGGNQIRSEKVTFPAGKSRFSFPITVSEPGYYEYTARIRFNPEYDSRQENNEVRNYLYLDGPGRLLVVTNPGADPIEWDYLVKALRQGDRQVEVIDANALPTDPLSLMPYDGVFFCDVPADAFTSGQLYAMHDGVRNLGIGFMMVGGPNSFGPGGYRGSPIEDILPVSLEISNKKVLPKGALVIVLHTCEFPAGNTWAKRITKRAIQVLTPDDLVGAIGYGMTGNEWIFEMTEAANFDALVPKINAAQIGDMPDFASSMELGLTDLIKTDAASRHMIIISDGDASPPSPELLQQFIDERITVSTVAVFPHDGDVSTLEQIASVTEGRFYYPSDPNELPSIFVKEAKTLRRDQIQRKPFVPELMNLDPVIKDIGQPPPLGGYVLTSPREDGRANLVFTAPMDADEVASGQADIDPVFAVWRYGLGVSAAFTSDLTSRWGEEW